MKTRKQKEREYHEKYGDIPLNLDERISYMIDKYNLSEKKMDEIIRKRDEMLSNLYFYECKVVVLEEDPEGTSRPRFRIINKQNFNRAALADPQFVHVYTPHAAEDHIYMHRLCENELIGLDYLINTPCEVMYDLFLKTPSSYNVTDIFLSEIGLIRPPIDNSGKKYSDMYNHNVWLDDALVFGGIVRKFYSIKPRVEIHLKYLNTVYNKKQYDRIIQRKDYDNGPLSYLDAQGRIVNTHERQI